MRAAVITNCQRGAVCALILVGMSMTDAAKVVRAPYRAMRAMLPADWRRKRRACKWSGERLEKARAAFCDHTRTVAQAAESLGMTRQALEQLAHRHGWPPRRRGRPKLANSIRSMDAQHRNLYRKLQPTVGREKALAAVFPQVSA